MTEPRTIVLKFGGSVLRTKSDLPRVVHEIYRHWRDGNRILVVVSAFQGVTDSLMDESEEFGRDHHPEAFAALLLTGEARSGALLGMALKNAGIPSRVLSPVQIGLRTVGDALNGEPVSFEAARIIEELSLAVVVVSGFGGVNEFDDLTLLGRGGSDQTALFLAAGLNAECLLIKDVDGLYESDPKTLGITPRRLKTAGYQTAVRLGGELVQPMAVHLAEKNMQPFRIAGLESPYSTTIGRYSDQIASPEWSVQSPIRVALLGCGTVGGGVYRRLAAMADKFEVVGVANLHRQRAIDSGIPAQLIRNDPWALVESECDAVIELIGGTKPASDLIRHALKLQKHVITANKAVLATDGPGLAKLARDFGISLSYRASVGGSMPALETAARLARHGTVMTIRGIINGTSNFICDRLASGMVFERAVELAKENGYAESDPTLDLNGIDPAQKLAMLARTAFGKELPLDEIVRVPLDLNSQVAARAAKAKGLSYRVVAECRVTEKGLDATVRPTVLAPHDPLASVNNADNCLVFETDDGRCHVINGVGAGRYPTTEAVIADVLDLYRAFQPFRTADHKQVDRARSAVQGAYV